MLWIKSEFGSGHIETAIREAKKFSVNNDVGVILNFNGVEISVSPYSKESELLEFYHSAISRPTQLAHDAGDATDLEALSNASANTTSQAGDALTQRV